MARLDIDGIGITFIDTGSGAPPLLFVHGFGGTRAHFAPQIAHFSKAHRVVVPDRRGHGESDKPAQDYTVDGIADDLATLIRELGMDRPVVVQHSFDRPVFSLAARYPDLVGGLCILDGPTLAGPGFDAAAKEFLAGLESPYWREAIRGFAENMVFAPGMPDAMKDTVIDEVAATGQPVLASTWREFIGYPTEAVLPDVRCPLLYVSGSFPSDLDALRTYCPQLEVAEVRGAGHLIQLTSADRVNEILDGFLARVAASV